MPPDDLFILEALNDQPAESTAPKIVETIEPPLGEISSINNNYEHIYVDPLATTRRSQRIQCPTRHFDESNLSEFVNKVIDDTPFHSLTAVALAAQDEAATKLNDMEGHDPSDFIPEPQSLRAIKRLQEKSRKAWIRAYRAELNNLL